MKTIHSIYKDDPACRIVFGFLIALICLFSQNAQAQYEKTGYVGDYLSFSFVPQFPGTGWVETVVWESDNPTLVSVSNSGATAAVGRILNYFKGYVIVRATYYYRYYVTDPRFPRASHATRTFSVSCNQVQINLTTKQLTLSPGETYKLNYTLTPNISSTVVGWISGNEEVASVNNSGVVTAVGPGTTRVYGLTNSSTSSYCEVTVVHYDPTSISLPATANVYLEGSTQLTPSFEPEHASSKLTWESSNTDVANVSETGLVTPVSVGTAVITATTKNGLSAKTTVTVSEPPFVVSSMTPENNATGISAFVSPQITYSLDLYKGSAFANIRLKADGKDAEGVVSIDGNKLVFAPAHPLMENADYTLSVPEKALANKWGTEITTATNLYFKTGPYEKLSLAVSMHGGYVLAGKSVELTTDFESAEIRYTTDGTIPTQQSTLYTGPIVLYQDVQLRARAFKEGYAPSDIVAEDFIMSDMAIKKMFPTNEQIYVYSFINPYIEFSSNISISNNINNVCVLRDNLTTMLCDIIVQGNTMYVVPEKQFESGHSYTIKVPDDALRNSKGEPNVATEWSFATGNFITDVSAGLDLFAVRKTDGTLLIWGNVLAGSDDATGSCSYNQKFEPTLYAKGIEKASIGLTHYSMLGMDKKLQMWGRQYCGEFGNGNNDASITPIEVMNDVTSVSNGGQTTAILKEKELYLCGRNDYGQIGDGTTEHRNTPVKVMDDVQKCVAGYGSTYAITSDGTLWAWGRNEHGELGDGTQTDQHNPISVMSGVKDVAAARLDGYGATVLKDDGTLWTLGETTKQVMGNVKSMAVGADFMAAVKEDGTLWMWGANDVGQLGDGSYSHQDTPVKIMENISRIDCGYKNAIALREDGSVYTWGKMPWGGYNSYPEKRIEGVVFEKLKGLTVSLKEIKLSVGEKTVVQILPDPLNANFTAWDWQTSNSRIATVDEHGVVEAKSKGTATITLSSDNGISASCRIQVGDAAYGDANDDGVVDKKDYKIVVDYIARKNPSGFNFKNADINEDGVIDINDLTGIVNIITQQ